MTGGKGNFHRFNEVSNSRTLYLAQRAQLPRHKAGRYLIIDNDNSITCPKETFHYSIGVVSTNLESVFVWDSFVSLDARGRFIKSFGHSKMPSEISDFRTVEHFFTESRKNVVRGLHFQGLPHECSKIISIVRGSVSDFLFDMRVESSTFGCSQRIELQSDSPKSVYIPPGVAHGYFVHEEETIVSYRQNREFCPKCDSGINPNMLSRFFDIDFTNAIISDRDYQLPGFEDFQYTSNCDL